VHYRIQSNLPPSLSGSSETAAAENAAGKKALFMLLKRHFDSTKRVEMRVNRLANQAARQQQQQQQLVRAMRASGQASGRAGERASE
jgi:hypothetical protein